MQIFLPEPDIYLSLKFLDNQRLGKQRVEAFQIIKALYVPNYGWSSHPATRMVKNTPGFLRRYYNMSLLLWQERGFLNTMQPFETAQYSRNPWWFGHYDFHASHRVNLIRKRPDIYRERWPDQCLKQQDYLWPQDEKNYFRVGATGRVIYLPPTTT